MRKTGFWTRIVGETVFAALACGGITGFIFKVVAYSVDVALPETFIWGATAVSSVIGGLFAISDVIKRWRIQLTDDHLERGNAAYDKGEIDLAIREFSRASQLRPKYLGAYALRTRGICYACKKDFDNALADFAEAIRLAPEESINFVLRGCAFVEKRQYENAIADLTEGVRLGGTEVLPVNTLAWLLATCPEGALRNGTGAVELARKACGLTDWKDAVSLDTLAAACAECGDFKEAVEWEKKAIELCQDKDRLEKFRDRLSLYEQERPYRPEGLTTG